MSYNVFSMSVLSCSISLVSWFVHAFLFTFYTHFLCPSFLLIIVSIPLFYRLLCIFSSFFLFLYFSMLFLYVFATFSVHYNTFSRCVNALQHISLCHPICNEKHKYIFDFIYFQNNQKLPIFSLACMKQIGILLLFTASITCVDHSKSCWPITLIIAEWLEFCFVVNCFVVLL